MSLYLCALAGLALAAGGDAGATTAGDALKLELTVATVRRGPLTFLQATAKAINTGKQDLWISGRKTARIWGSHGVPWVFQVTREDRAPPERTVQWLCRIREFTHLPVPQARLAAGKTMAVELPHPCARLVEPGRYVVVVTFHGDVSFEAKGPPARVSIASGPKLVGVGP